MSERVGVHAPRLLPAGSRLVHIGPHKTGTTAVQQAFDEARAVLAERGVHYAGPMSQVYQQALGLTGKPGQRGDEHGDEKDWLALVEEVRRAGPARVVMSSESFANAEPEHVRRLASDLGPDRVHVVRMVRRYDSLVTSQWQQLVASGHRRSFVGFVRGVSTALDGPFWTRHGFVPLTQRWADGVGRDRVSVVVVNEADHGWLLRVFEAMLGLESGLLVAPAEPANRSLTAAEVELLRGMNRIRVLQGWDDRTHLEFVRRGVSVGLRRLTPDPRDGRVVVPETLVPFLRERTDRDLAALAELGVEVVGDLAWLEVAPRPPSSEQGERSVGSGTLRVSSAVAAARAVVERTLEGVTIPLGGAGPELAEPLADGRRRALTPAEQRLVAELEAEGWPEAVTDRLLRRGLVAWLRRSGTGPRPRDTAVADDPDRLDPRRAAVALSGLIAQSDPAAAAVG